MKFTGKVNDFMVMQMAIARIYPGWLLMKAGNGYRIYCDKSLMYNFDDLDQVSQLTGIGLVAATAAHGNFRID